MDKKEETSLNDVEEKNDANKSAQEEIDYTQEGTIYGLEEDLKKEEEEKAKKKKVLTKGKRLLVVIIVLLIFCIGSFFKYKGEYLRAEEIG